jgi:uncharacterized protein YndB with AHSA1/START domain
MEDSRASHESFSIVRMYPAERTEVWAAWSVRDKKAAWLHCANLKLDFRVGGTERASYTEGRDKHVNETRYFEIAELERIVLAYSMARNTRVHTVSLATITFADAEVGTCLTYTEQMSIFPPSDGRSGRQHGWNLLLDSLGEFLNAFSSCSREL